MDALIEEIGGLRFQMVVTVSIKFGVASMAWNMMQMAFAGLVPDWWCVPDHPLSSLNVSNASNWSRDNLTYQVCQVPGNEEESCAGYVQFDQSVRTVINEWSLICDRSYLKGLMTSLQMAGVLLGALIGGQVADSFGRRSAIYVSSLCHIVATLVAAFSVTWQMFIVMRVVIGVTIGVFLVTSFSFLLEFVKPQHRQMVTFVPGWIVGISLFALVAWCLPNWSHLHVGCALLGLPFLLTAFVVPESARWLATRGRLEEAEAVVERMARMNGSPVPPDTRKRLQEVAEEEKRAGQGRRYTYLDVYRGLHNARTSLTLHFIWFSLSFSYYGIAFGVTGLSGNLYLNIFLLVLVEIPSTLSTVCLLNKIGRRWACFLYFALCSLASFAILVVNQTDVDRGSATTALAMVSKLSVGAAWLAVMTFTAEQYPTVMRNLGYGASNMMARIGGVLAPIILNMDTTEEVVRGYVVVGALMAASGLACLTLTETNGLCLPDSLHLQKTSTGHDNIPKDKNNSSCDSHNNPEDNHFEKNHKDHSLCKY